MKIGFGPVYGLQSARWSWRLPCAQAEDCSISFVLCLFQINKLIRNDPRLSILISALNKKEDNMVPGTISNYYKQYNGLEN